ncbi:hypothetical protein [Francisella tularensis]|nr:hypothetical protein [Francisella tularensis]
MVYCIGAFGVLGDYSFLVIFYLDIDNTLAFCGDNNFNIVV